MTKNDPTQSWGEPAGHGAFKKGGGFGHPEFGLRDRISELHFSRLQHFNNPVKLSARRRRENFALLDTFFERIPLEIDF